jgi:hypothetical protein
MLTRVSPSVPSPGGHSAPQVGARLTLAGAGSIVVEPDRHDPETRNERHRMA